MTVLIILLLAIFPLGQLVRVNFPGSEIVVHPNDLVVGAVVLLGWWMKRKTIFTNFLAQPLTKPLLFFATTVVISLVFNITRFSPAQLLSSALYPIRFFVYAGLFYLFSCSSSIEKSLTKRWLLISVIIITVFDLAQYIFVPNVAFLSAFDWDDHYYRLVGSFLDPGFTGAVLSLGLVFIFLSVKRIKQWNNLTILAIVYSALALTYSRASYLMYLVSFATISFYRRSIKIVIIATAILAITLLILPKTFGEGTKLAREKSIVARVKNWGISINVWQKSPVWGIGFNTYRYAVGVEPQSHSGGADSSILLVLATTGILGLVAYCNVLKTMWRLGRGNLLFKASFLAVLIHSWFNNTLFYPWVMEWLWIVLAVTVDTSQ